MKIKIAIVISDFNEEITSKMEKAAEKQISSLDLELIKKIHVPGAFEIPFAVNQIMKKGKVDAIVVLGAVIQGDTDHDVLITNTVAKKLMDLSLNFNKPLGLGIIGPRVTWEQADERAIDYAERAVETAVKMVKLNKE